MAEKPRFRRRTVFAKKNLGFRVGFGYRNNTKQTSQLRLRKKLNTVCTRVRVDPDISRPPLYRLVSDVADAINSIPRDAAVRKVHVFCDKINS